LVVEVKAVSEMIEVSEMSDFITGSVVRAPRAELGEFCGAGFCRRKPRSLFRKYPSSDSTDVCSLTFGSGRISKEEVK
jgi:hypothetical protein